MNLLKDYLRKELSNLVENGIRLQLVGRWRELDPSVVSELERALEATANWHGHAAQYRAELLGAVRDRRRLP